MGCVIPLPQDGLALRCRENVEAANRPFGCRYRHLQKSHQSSRQDLNAAAVKQIGRVFDGAADPVRRAVRGAVLAQAEPKINLSAAGSYRLESDRETVERKVSRRIVLERQNHLE